jgi:hypothetical protein
MNTSRCLKTGKIKYASGVAAQAATTSMLLYGGHVARIYKCHWCRCFHVTRKQLRESKRVTNHTAPRMHFSEAAFRQLYPKPHQEVVRKGSISRWSPFTVRFGNNF